MADRIRVLLTEEEVDKRINEVAAKISEDYAGKQVHMICILKGGVFFTCELAKRMTVPVSLDFMSVSSYGGGTVSSGVVRIVKDLDESLEGKDVLIIDDMISSGESVLDVAKELKRRKARKVFVCSTFGLFTGGLNKFDEYYEKGIIDRILTTNLVYQTPSLLERPYYIDVDMSKYIALIIDNLNHDASLSELLTPTKRINKLLAQYRS